MYCSNYFTIQTLASRHDSKNQSPLEIGGFVTSRGMASARIKRLLRRQGMTITQVANVTSVQPEPLHLIHISLSALCYRHQVSVHTAAEVHIACVCS